MRAKQDKKPMVSEHELRAIDAGVAVTSSAALSTAGPKAVGRPLKATKPLYKAEVALQQKRLAEQPEQARIAERVGIAVAAVAHQATGAGEAGRLIEVGGLGVFSL